MSDFRAQMSDCKIMKIKVLLFVQRFLEYTNGRCGTGVVQQARRLATPKKFRKLKVAGQMIQFKPALKQRLQMPVPQVLSCWITALRKFYFSKSKI